MSPDDVYNKILIIDDEISVLNVYAKYLQSLGYNVSTALSGEEGLKLIEESQPHLVLVDLYMKGMSGFEVIEKGLKINPDLLFIVISGKGDKEDVVKALRVGAWDYFFKPLTNWGVITNTMDQALERTKFTKEHRSCQENLAEAIFKAVDSGIVIVDYKSERIVDVNPKACIIFGVQYDKIIGSKCCEYLCHSQQESCIMKQLSSPEERAKYLDRSTLDFTRGDGSIVHLIKSVVTLVWRGRQQLVCSVVDVTEEVILTEELKHQKTLAQIYMDVAQDIFIALDLDGNIKLINKAGCEILKVKEEEYLGKNWFDNFVPSYELYKIKKEFEKLLTSEDISECESWVIDSQGEAHLIRWKNTVVRNSKGCVESTFSSGEDITDIKMAEQELEKYWRKVESELQDNIIQLKSRGVSR